MLIEIQKHANWTQRILSEFTKHTYKKLSKHIIFEMIFEAQGWIQNQSSKFGVQVAKLEE